MTLQEMLDDIADIHVDSGKSAADLEVVIEDQSGTEYIIDRVYFADPFGIGIDIKERDYE